MGSRLSIAAPEDFALARDANSYGYVRLAPDRWDATENCLRTVFDLDEGPAKLRIAQRAPARLEVVADRSLSRSEQQTTRGAIARMLRLDESAAQIAAFHAVDPRWRASGRGRVFRSPTLFQDVIRTVTSCNVAWSSTVNMNARFCTVLGRGGAFPQVQRLARVRPGTLRGRCRVGYRDQRIIDLAKMFADGSIDEAWLSDATQRDEDVFAFLKTLPGIGPYAAANIMQLLGRYSFLAVDSESVRHGRQELGMVGEDARVIAMLRQHYEPFGAHKFRSYWFELWTAYERKAGPAHEWKPA
jgi:3-methyladenine DNA glycosylase/8-oxoguanine DNA glycosylase